MVTNNITGIGVANGIGFKRHNNAGGNYISPDVLNALCGVWIADQNNNNSPTRNIIKNKLKDRGGDLEVLNAAYKLNSGYGKYEEDFTTLSNRSNTYIELTPSSILVQGKISDLWLAYTIINPFNTIKIRIKNLPIGGRFEYRYYNGIVFSTIAMEEDGEYKLPASQQHNNGIGFRINDNNLNWKGFIVEQIPSFQGALVTDGVDDSIVSQKTVQEMLDGSNEITVVSMIHLIDINHSISLGNTNYVRVGNSFIRNSSKVNDKTGIYGWTCSNSSNITSINNILGDKNDYSTVGPSLPLDSKFSVEGYSHSSGISELCQVAWYWTFIAKKALTTDEINQVIAYYNLDKYVKPDIYYDVKKQGLSNNTPDADWYLKDFSGNGRDMQLYNYDKTPESGINEEGGLQSDGVTDYGQFVGDLGLKDFTIAVDRAYPSIIDNAVPIVAGTTIDGENPFIFEYTTASNAYKVIVSSFKTLTITNIIKNTERAITYQSTYKYLDAAITRGNSVGTGDGLTIGRNRINTQYDNIALWSFLLFPYTLSEFLLERQLKRYKLGTLYPDMVEFRPIIKSNIPYDAIEISQGSTVLYNKSINKTGIYLQEGSTVRVYIKPSGIDEVSKITINGVSYTDLSINPNGYYYADFPITKSPQKISYVIDEYVRYEDIVQPYPIIVRIQDNKTNKLYTYGDKIKVGTELKYTGATNLLPELYKILGDIKLNGKNFNSKYTGIVEKTNVFTFTTPCKYLKTNEPNCILAPQILRIPNSSYKILGYIPDLTGKGNHGVFNNFAFTEESGVDSNGIVHFDGVEDYITIPTLSHGAKQVLMKVNWNKSGMMYDQRTGLNSSFAIYSLDVANYVAYNRFVRNGNTYIDGVLNQNILCVELKGITHNIICTNGESPSQSPIIGSNFEHKQDFSKMALFAFISFDEISDENEIKELNDIIGIEGGYVESPDYYWDAYGKNNLATLDIDYQDLFQSGNANKMLIDKSKTGLAALDLYHNTGNVTELNNRRLNLNNFAFNEESGYGGWLGIIDLATSFTTKDFVTNKWKKGGTIVKGKNGNTNFGCGHAQFVYYDSTNYIAKFKIKVTGLVEGEVLNITQYGDNGTSIEAQQLFNGINEITLDVSNSNNPNYKYFTFKYPPLTNDVDFEFLYEYQNGLVSDGVEDYLINTVIPAVTDFTVIAKRTDLREPANGSSFIQKGLSEGWNGGGAFSEGRHEEGNYYCSSFGRTNSIDNVYNKKFFYQTPTSYNKVSINNGSKPDSNGLIIGVFVNSAGYRNGWWKGVFYKAMLYSNTIDQLSINMLKNLFEKDELIDVKHKIFKNNEDNE